MDYGTLVGESIRGLSPYAAGMSVEQLKARFALERVLKFASNESPLPPSDRVRDTVAQAVAMSHHYPDYTALKSAIASGFGLDAGHVVLGAGSIDVLDVIFQTFSGGARTAVFPRHGYFAYPMLAAKAGLHAVNPEMDRYRHDVDGLVAACDGRTSLLVLDSPGNFSGGAIDADALQRILDGVPETTIVVLDQAYIEFADDEPVAIDAMLFERHKRLIVTRTFSKIHGLAALRIGYGMAHPDLIAWLNRVQQPFPVSNVAAAAAICALDDRAHSEAIRRTVVQGRSQLSEGLAALGVPVCASQANFVLARFDDRAAALNQALLREGLITRQTLMYGEPGHIRISVGTAQDNAVLLAAISAFLSSDGQSA